MVMRTSSAGKKALRATRRFSAAWRPGGSNTGPGQLLRSAWFPGNPRTPALSSRTPVGGSGPSPSRGTVSVESDDLQAKIELLAGSDDLQASLASLSRLSTGTMALEDLLSPGRHLRGTGHSPCRRRRPDDDRGQSRRHHRGQCTLRPGDRRDPVRDRRRSVHQRRRRAHHHAIGVTRRRTALAALRAAGGPDGGAQRAVTAVAHPRRVSSAR